jgi:predicted DNA-binding transcriptional regulator AlpA
MKTLSTTQAAQKLGIAPMTMSRYIKAGKVPKPRSATSGGMTIHFWTEEEIEHVRQLLPKIANGRKTRYQKKHSAVSTQQSVKPKKKAKTKKQQTTRKPKR